MNDAHKILDWDSEFFGFKVASIQLNSLQLNDLLMSFRVLKDLNVKLVYLISSKAEEEVLKFADSFNGKLVDIKTTYSIQLESYVRADVSDNISLYSNNYASPDLLALAVQCGKFSRFSVDPLIPSNKMQELYQIWINKSVLHQMADETIVYTQDNKIVGLITVYTKNRIGNIGLVGVDESYRGKGIGGELIKASLNYFKEKGINEVEVVTQGLNKAACSLYEKFGFTVKSQFDFYHFWL